MSLVAEITNMHLKSYVPCSG